MVFANENKRNFWNCIRFPIVIFIAAMFKTGLPMKLDKFATSVCFVALAVLPSVGVHVGEIISKTIINMFVYILGALLGYGLRKLPENEIGTGFRLLVLFIIIALGIYGRSLIKKRKDGYENAPIAFLMAVFVTLEYPSGPDVWLTEFSIYIITLLLASWLIILSSFLLPFFAGDEVHNEAQENIHILAGIFEDFLNRKCFGLSQNLQNKLLSVINSKEKENSLGKFVCWEPRWHPQEQYEKIGDCIRLCASYTLSLLTYLDSVQFSPDLQEICKEIWSELAKALTLLYDSMKHKTAPAASINSHLTRVQDLTTHLKSWPIQSTILLEYVKLIEKLASSIKELATLVPFKQSEQDSNVSGLLTGWFLPGIQAMGTRANQLLVAPMKNMVSGLFASLKKLIIKCSSAPNGPDTTQPRVNSV